MSFLLVSGLRVNGRVGGKFVDGMETFWREVGLGKFGKMGRRDVREVSKG